MRTPEQIKQAKERFNDLMIKTEVSALPLGYLAGGELTITDSDVVVNPLIANVNGKQIFKPRATNIRDATWRAIKINSTRYYIYLNRFGSWFVDAVEPVFVQDKIGKYNPRTSDRNIGTFYVNSDGNYEEITESEKFRELALVDMTTGSVLFIGADGVLTEDNNNFFWDDTNNRLGIGTSTPATALDIEADGSLGALRIKSDQTSGRGGHIRLSGLTDGTMTGWIGLDTDAGETAHYLAINAEDEGVAWRNIALANQGGNVGIGTTSPAASAKLEISSTTGAFLLPRMTTTERNALTAVNGMRIYNTTTNQFEAYEAGAWVNK
jgi:hypothetical protein